MIKKNITRKKNVQRKRKHTRRDSNLLLGYRRNLALTLTGGHLGFICTEFRPGTGTHGSCLGMSMKSTLRQGDG